MFKKALIIIAVLVVSVFSKQIIIENNVQNLVDSIEVNLVDGKPLLRITEFIKKVEPQMRWNILGKKLTVFTAADTLRFEKNNHFYKLNRKLKQLFSPPRNDGGDFYVYRDELINIVKSISNFKIDWDPHINVLTIEGDAIASMAPEVTVGKGVIESIKTVVIDPGHGGKDVGAVGPTNIYEKDVVLAIGLEVRKLLKEKTDIQVFMTRDTDIFIPLRQRTRFANDKKADLFISIHANSIGGDRSKKERVKGYKMYFLSHAKNEDDKRAAMIENSVIELEEESSSEGNYLENILNDMANNEYLKESQDLSIKIAESFSKNIAQSRKLHTGVGQANFWVLNGAYMPAVLVEAAFISNYKEEKLLASTKFQKKIAKSICDAVIDFKNKYEGN